VSGKAMMAVRALDLRPMMKRQAISAKSVLQSLADHHNEKYGRCFPGQRAIARQSGLLLGYVTTVLERLEALRLIKINRATKRWSYELLFVTDWAAAGEPRLFIPFDSLEHLPRPVSFGAVEQKPAVAAVQLGGMGCSTPDAMSFDSGREIVLSSRTESPQSFNPKRESARTRANGVPSRKGQPPFEEMLRACLANNVRPSHWEKIEEVIEEAFGFELSRAQLEWLQRQLIDRSGG
jgi:hypothetical protein